MIATMDFQTAITTCFTKYADFEGRASKEEFLWWLLLAIPGAWLLMPISGTLTSIFTLVTFMPTLAVSARRLHDIGYSGWYQLVWLIPVVGLALMIYWGAQPSVAQSKYAT